MYINIPGYCIHICTHAPFMYIPVFSADIVTDLEEILRRVKDLSTRSNERHWKINGITDELKCLQNDFVSLSQRVAYLKSANSKITNDVDACEEHDGDTTESLGELHGCLEELQVTLDTIERFVHPCGGSGWRQIVDFDMSNPTTMCPTGWLEIISNTGIRSCGRTTDSSTLCCSTFYDIPDDEPYHQVCGKVIGYQQGEARAFFRFRENTGLTLEDAFVVGLIFTRGAVGSREHIWTFGAGFSKQSTSAVLPDSVFCPCVQGEDDYITNVGIPPPFLNGEYFCESGIDSIGDDDPSTALPNLGDDIEVDDPLWDGLGCAADSECCETCDLPYFHKVFDTSTSDDIEARLCFTGHDVNIGIGRIELYVK